MSNSEANHAGTRRTPAVLYTAVWTGVVVGLVEGVGWLIIQHLGRLTQLWTQVLWITPILDGLLFLLLGLVLAALGRFVPHRLWHPAAYFTIAAFAAINFVSLVLGPYVYRSMLVVLALGIASVMFRAFNAREEAAVSFFRRSLPVLGGGVALLLVGVQSFYAVRERMDVRALPEAEPSAPDVVVVVLDALRADHLSSYGYERPTSPFIDSLADRGVLFERAISASPYSLPSHASLLSGLHPYQHGVEWLEFKVFRDAEYPSIAEAMSDLGYQTAAFSANPFWLTREQGFGRGFTRFEDYYHSVADMAYRTVFGNNFLTLRLALGFDQVPARKWATENTDRVLRWVHGGQEQQPLFAFINYFDIHAPYTPPQPYRGRFSDLEAPGGELNWLMDRRGDTQLTPEQRASEIDGYDGAIAYVDDELRRLIEGIRTERQERDLLIVVTSDHGEAFGEHGGYLHARSLYREELQIPLIIQGPGVPSGTRIARPVTHTSLPATILDLVSDGRVPTFGAPSLTALWTDPAAASTWEWPLAEAGERAWAHESFPMHHGDMRSLFSPNWHFIAHEVFPSELYSWSDTLEAHDRAADPELQYVIEKFEQTLEAGESAYGGSMPGTGGAR